MKKACRNLYFLMFLNGFLMASLFYFKMRSSYENGLFYSIKASIDSRVDANDNQDSIILKAMDACNSLMKNRGSVFQSKNELGFEADFFRPASVDLMTTRGACGSFSEVLARILDTYHYPIRIAQMKANGTFAAHNIVEVQTSHGWVVLDPTFNAHFTRPDSKLASFDDVHRDWNYYAKQVPPGYDLTYHFEDVRYTNWTKIPILFPAVKQGLILFMGAEKVNTLSVRTYFLKIYDIYFYLFLFIFIPVILGTVRSLIKIKLFPDKNTPFTYGNLIKYLKPLFNGGSPKRIQSF